MKIKRMERYINHWGCISTREEVIQIGCLSIKLSSISFFMHHETDICAICHLTKVSTMTGETCMETLTSFPLQTCKLLMEVSRARWIKSKERRKEKK